MASYLSYILDNNPWIKSVFDTGSELLERALSAGTNAAAEPTATQTIAVEVPCLWDMLGWRQAWVRLAGISGLSAIMFGYIGSRYTHTGTDKGESRIIFESANRAHMLHTMMLLCVPAFKHPMVTGTLTAIGICVFSGERYYRSLSGNHRYVRLAWVGGSFLALAWLSLVL